MSDTLFDLPSGAVHTPPKPAKLSAGERRRALHLHRMAHGYHPLSLVGFTPLRLHPDAPPGPRCGSCWHRQLVDHRAKTFPKCFAQDGLRVTHSEASDVAAWWPACIHHSYGDPKLSPDAARYIPEVGE